MINKFFFKLKLLSLPIANDNCEISQIASRYLYPKKRFENLGIKKSHLKNECNCKILNRKAFKLTNIWTPLGTGDYQKAGNSRMYSIDSYELL